METVVGFGLLTVQLTSSGLPRVTEGALNVNWTTGGGDCVRLMAWDAALPELGVTTSEPVNVPLVVVLTVTEPQVLCPAHAPVGPLTDSPLGTLYARLVAAVSPLLTTEQVIVAWLGVVMGLC
jgi:hypothetical protein